MLSLPVIRITSPWRLPPPPLKPEMAPEIDEALLEISPSSLEISPSSLSELSLATETRAPAVLLPGSSDAPLSP